MTNIVMFEEKLISQVHALSDIDNYPEYLEALCDITRTVTGLYKAVDEESHSE